MTKTEPQHGGISIRRHGRAAEPVLVYLPGLHADWTLISSLRPILARDIHFVEITYPRTVDWTLEDYGAAVTEELASRGLKEVWLLAESFSSQVGWEILRQTGNDLSARIQVQGLILAGGFLRHPARWALPILRRLLGALPPGAWRWAFRVYALYGNFRHRNAPETRTTVHEFVARRTPEDIQAMLHRLDLIAGSDYREIARGTKVPVFALSGVIDPIVPWWHAFPSLRRQCGALAGRKLVWPADHNVLGTEPEQSARMILKWMGLGKP